MYHLCSLWKHSRSVTLLAALGAAATLALPGVVMAQGRDHGGGGSSSGRDSGSRGEYHSSPRQETSRSAPRESYQPSYRTPSRESYQPSYHYTPRESYQPNSHYTPSQDYRSGSSHNDYYL